MEHKKVFDSNVWIALFNQRDATHSLAIDAKEESNFEVILPDFILAETASVLKYKAGFQIAKKFIVFVQDNEDVEIMYTSFHFDNFIKSFLTTGRNNLSFVDSSLRALSGEFEVITFDKKLKNAIKKKRK